MKLWGGRFTKKTDKFLEEFGASIHFDHILWREDIKGSQAHIQGLAQANIITQGEASQLDAGLQTLATKIDQGKVSFSVEDEDVHMNIERLLHQEIGDVAGKLHTGRSRNDQVALDMRLYMRRQLLLLLENLGVLRTSLLQQAKHHVNTIFPGYTHLQHAQPVRLAHHFLAYCWMFFRDGQRLIQNFTSTNQFPLGAGAMAGSSFSINQQDLADKLHFYGVYENSIDAVSDRDYLVEFLSNASLIMMHLSKLCEELIMWSSQEFSYVELDDAFCTGSSMMPQKKNPDSAELIRGKTGRVYGALISLLTTLKSLPLAYNKDLQEDKEGVFDALSTLHSCITIMSKMIATLTVNEANIKIGLASGFLNATELANYLVKKGMPFRLAHELVGNAVKHCLLHKVSLDKDLLHSFSTLFEEDVVDLLSLENVIEHQNNVCGTAKSSVEAQIQSVEESLRRNQDWLERHQAILDN